MCAESTVDASRGGGSREPTSRSCPVAAKQQGVCHAEHWPDCSHELCAIDIPVPAGAGNDDD